MSTELLEESQVSIISLSMELEKASIAYKEAGKDAVYVQEAGLFPTWVRIRQESKFIMFTTYLDFKPNNDESMLHFCNTINDNLYLPTVSQHPVEHEGKSINRMYASHVLLYRDGILVSHFIRMLRQFSQNMYRIQEEYDKDGVMLERL